MEKQWVSFQARKELVLYKFNYLCLSPHTYSICPLYLSPVSTSVILPLFIFRYLNSIFPILFIHFFSFCFYKSPIPLTFLLLCILCVIFFFLHCIIPFLFSPFLYYQLFLLFFLSSSPPFFSGPFASDLGSGGSHIAFFK
jgi:hypothetical protein